jgi:DNA-binding LacI/PurR family transcriptional regulator
MMKKAVSKALQGRSGRWRLASGSARKSTIYDVANDAGVSIATVSRFLKGFEPIAEETKKRVRASIRRLDYRPSALATSLASRFKQSVGFLIPRGSRAYADLFLSEILSGVSNGAAKHGWSIHITMLADDDSLAAQLQRHAALVDGSLVLDEALDHAAVRALLDSGHRSVLLNALKSRIPSVGIDNIAGSMDAIRHLVALGHTRIACLSGGGEIGRERMKGFRAGLQEAGLKPVALADCEFQRGGASTPHVAAPPDRHRGGFGLDGRRRPRRSRRTRNQGTDGTVGCRIR